MMKSITVFCLLSIVTVFQLNAKSQQARWITAFENQNATNTWLCFRYEFEVDNVPEEANTKIAVDSKYWLWINGQLVVFEGGVKRGPNPEDTYYDLVDIAPYLQKGSNTIAALVWYFGKGGFSYNPSGEAGLFIDCSSDSGFQLISNSEWLSRVHPAYFTAGCPLPNFRLSESSILFDARYDIENWHLPTYEAGDWKRAKEIGKEGDGPWNKLHHRVIPLWKDYGISDYTRIENKPGEQVDTMICTLPYNAQITPYLQVEAPPGEKVIIYTDQYQGGGPYNVRAEYITKAGSQEYENYGWINGHKVIYLVPKNVTVKALKYRETSYDTEFAGTFECSDPFLNRLWEKSRRTLLVTMRDTYMDCPDRERAQWWGDEVNESGEAFYALDIKSHLLMKKGMYELIGWQRDDSVLFSPIPASNWNTELPGQMLASIGYYGFWNYYLNTGDKQVIEDLYEGVKKYLRVWDTDENGNLIFRNGDWTWGDWGTNIDTNILFNEWYYLALKGTRNMAELLGYQHDAKEFSRELVAFKKAFNKSFWTGKVYKHPEYTGDTDDRVQALAVVSGLADPELYPAILKVLKKKEYASPYMEKYVIEALFKMGNDKYGIERLKRRFNEMVVDPNLTTLYEGWSIKTNDFGTGTVNHAWSGGGLTILSQYVGGIAPLEAGYKIFEVMPQPADLEYAKTEIASVSGQIKSSFSNEPKRFVLSVHVPENTSAILGIPKERVRKVVFNGEPIWDKDGHIGHQSIEFEGEDDQYLKFRVNGGDYQLVAIK